MFKLAIFAAILAVAVAAPGGLTGLVLDHGIGPIHAPNVISHAPIAPVHVVHQAPAPVVHQVPIVTKTILPVHGYGHGHGLLGLH